MFIIPYAYTETLYTRYAVYNQFDEDLIISYKKRIMDEINIEDAKKAVGQVWDGTRPTDTVTREEAAAMTYRAMQKLLNPAV